MKGLRRRSLLLLLLIALPGRAAHGAPAGDVVEPFIQLPWSPTGAKAGSRFGDAVAPAGDVNGDGYGDVLVGAPGDSLTLFAQGRAFLYLGSASGLAANPVWSYTGTQMQCQAGSAVASAGDVNGDGYADILLGMEGWDSLGVIDPGRVLVFHGGPNGPGAAPNRILAQAVPTLEAFFGKSVGTAGDVNADGYADVVIGVPGYSDAGASTRGAAMIYMGSATGLAPTPARTLIGRPQSGSFGQAVSTAGDIDADGYDDVVVGAPFETANFAQSGAASIYRGSAAGLIVTPDTTLSGFSAQAHAGVVVANLGDLNGDGYADLLVGEPQATFDITPQCGMVRRYYGGPGGIIGGDVTLGPVYLANEEYGLAVAPMGDLNGDGYADYGTTGRNFPTGNHRFTVVLADGGEGIFAGSTYPPVATTGSFALSIATAGDVDGDGIAEMLIGDSGAPVGNLAAAGRVYLLAMPRSLPRPVPGWPLVGAEPGSRFGQAITIAPGFLSSEAASVVIGDPGFQGTGRIRGHVPVKGGISQAAQWSVTGAGDFSSMGSRLVDAGDVDGDGWSDLAVSLPTTSFVPAAPQGVGGTAGTGSQVGTVDLYRGGPNGPVISTRIVTGTTDFDRVGSALAGRGDVNGDGYHDFVVGAEGWDSASLQDCGKVWVVYGGPAGQTMNSWTVQGASTRRGLGAGVALADLDADGYSDVIIGSVSAQGITEDGRVQVHYGGPSGPSSVPGLVLAGNPTTPTFGRTVVSLGDVTGDGVCDLAVGAPEAEDVGAVSVFAGSLGRSQRRSAVRVYRGTQVGARYGEAIAGGGDLNGDGIGDLVIGAPRFDGLQVDEGKVEIRAGAIDVPSAALETSLGSGINGAQFGGSIAPLADLNDDGLADLIIGAPGAAGRVYAYLGEGGPGFRSALRLLELAGGDLTERLHPARLGTGGEAWARVDLASPAGRSRAWVEFEAVPQNVAFTGRPTSRHPVPFDTGIMANSEFAELPVPQLLPGRGYHVRSRLVSRSPFYPRSAWTSPEAHESGDLDLWMAGAVVDAGAADIAHAPHITRITPNPVVARGADVRVEFVLPAAGPVAIDVYDARGARVRRLERGESAAGPGTVTWDGQDDAGRSVPAGIYFLELRVGGQSDRVKLVCLPR